MIFDKSRIYTAVNADELKVNDKVYVSDSLHDLQYDVESECNLAIIQEIRSYDYNKRFRIKFIKTGDYDEYALAYLVEQAPEKKWRPFKDTNELIDAWIGKTCMLATTANTMPLIWLKNKEDHSICLITSFNTAIGEAVVSDSFYNLEGLFNRFEFIDGTPCGVKE